MEQTIQKPSLPIKTKIAAWWMIIISVILGCVGLRIAIQGYLHSLYGGVLLLPVGLGIFFMGGLLIFLPGLFLLKRKVDSWWVSVMILGIASTLSIFLVLTGFTLLELCCSSMFLIPFILLLLDRKNFWKIAV